jgi:hypothetical protein
MSQTDAAWDALYGVKKTTDQDVHPADTWTVNGKPYQPEYSLDSVSPDGLFGTTNAMSKRELYDYLLQLGGESALANPQQFISGTRFRPPEQAIFTKGSKKLVLPLYEDRLKPNKEDISSNRFGDVTRQSFALVDEGSSPFEPPSGWGDPSVFAPGTDAARFNALRKHFGTTAALAHNFIAEQQQPKVLPNELFQYAPPGTATAVGSTLAAAGSFVNVLRDRNAWDVAQGVMKASDDDGIKRSIYSAKRGLAGLGVNAAIPFSDRWNSANEIKEAMSDIKTRYTDAQLASMGDDEIAKLATESIKAKRWNSVQGDISDMQRWDKMRSDGILDYRTDDFYKDWGELPFFGQASKLTQTAAGSAAPTILPMLASFIGSATRIPGANTAGMAAATYELSANSEIQKLMSEWAQDKGIPMGAPPDVIVQKLQQLIQEDPQMFKMEMRSMINEARLSGALEAGLAVGLNHAVEMIKIPGAEEGSIMEAARHGFQPRVAKLVLIPRIKNAIQEMGREGVEESLTEVLKTIGMGTYTHARQGEDITDSFANALRDYGQKDLEAAAEAGAVGVWMSLMTKMITGHGNPDTALEIRHKAAQQIASRTGKSASVIDAQLEAIQRNLVIDEDAKKLELESLFKGKGTLEDQINREVDTSIANREVKEVPQNTQTYTPLSTLFGQPVTVNGSSATIVVPPVKSDSETVSEPGPGGLPAGARVLAPDEPVPRARVVNGKLRRFFREVVGSDGRKHLYEVTFQNDPGAPK